MTSANDPTVKTDDELKDFICYSCGYESTDANRFFKSDSSNWDDTPKNNKRIDLCGFCYNCRAHKIDDTLRSTDFFAGLNYLFDMLKESDR